MSEPDEKLQSRGGDMHARVKPLVWHDFSDRGAKAQAWNQANYMIQRWSDGRWEISASYPGYSTFIEETDRFHPSLDAAKAAAQADYEARILAALEPAPDMAELVEALRWYADDANYRWKGVQWASYEIREIVQDHGERARAALAKIKEQQA